MRSKAYLWFEGFVLAVALPVAAYMMWLGYSIYVRSY